MRSRATAIQAKADAVSLKEAEMQCLREADEAMIQWDATLGMPVAAEGSSALGSSEQLAQGQRQLLALAPSVSRPLMPQNKQQQEPWKAWKAPSGSVVTYVDAEAEEMASRLLASFAEFEEHKLSFVQFRE